MTDFNPRELQPITLGYPDYDKLTDAIFYIEQVLAAIDPNCELQEGANLHQAISLIEDVLQKAVPDPIATTEPDLSDIPF